MISFKQFLNEESLGDLDQRELVKMIRHDCHEFLKEAGDVNFLKGEVLLRGMKIPTSKIDRLTTIKDRSPKDSSPRLMRTLDSYFEKNYHTSFRKNSVFCTNDANEAGSYGPLFYIFPIGKFEYAWSPSIIDAWIFFENCFHPRGLKEICKTLGLDFRMFQRGDSRQAGDPANAEWYQIISDYLEAAKPYKVNEGLETFLKIKNAQDQVEIMIHCNEFYAIRANDYGQELVKQLMESE
jgi:hypothetical protein